MLNSFLRGSAGDFPDIDNKLSTYLNLKSGFERAGLQPSRKNHKMDAALAAEGYGGPIPLRPAHRIKFW
jgi:hypothetical protein